MAGVRAVDSVRHPRQRKAWPGSLLRVLRLCGDGRRFKMASVGSVALGLDRSRDSVTMYRGRMPDRAMREIEHRCLIELPAVANYSEHGGRDASVQADERTSPGARCERVAHSRNAQARRDQGLCAYRVGCRPFQRRRRDASRAIIHEGSSHAAFDAPTPVGGLGPPRACDGNSNNAANGTIFVLWRPN
jgi:hypothetical protein